VGSHEVVGCLALVCRELEPLLRVTSCARGQKFLQRGEDGSKLVQLLHVLLAVEMLHPQSHKRAELSERGRSLLSLGWREPMAVTPRPRLSSSGRVRVLQLSLACGGHRGAVVGLKSAAVLCRKFATR
jgi:hypothetical protein